MGGEQGLSPIPVSSFLPESLSFPSPSILCVSVLLTRDASVVSFCPHPASNSRPPLLFSLKPCIRAPSRQSGPCCCFCGSWRPCQQVQSCSDLSDTKQPHLSLCQPAGMGHMCALSTLVLPGKAICSRQTSGGDTGENLGTKPWALEVGLLLEVRGLQDRQPFT